MARRVSAVSPFGNIGDTLANSSASSNVTPGLAVCRSTLAVALRDDCASDAVGVGQVSREDENAPTLVRRADLRSTEYEHPDEVVRALQVTDDPLDSSSEQTRHVLSHDPTGSSSSNNPGPFIP